MIVLNYPQRKYLKWKEEAFKSVYRGEIQNRNLGMAMESWDENGMIVFFQNLLLNFSVRKEIC